MTEGAAGDNARSHLGQLPSGLAALLWLSISRNVIGERDRHGPRARRELSVAGSRARRPPIARSAPLRNSFFTLLLSVALSLACANCASTDSPKQTDEDERPVDGEPRDDAEDTGSERLATFLGGTMSQVGP